MITVCEVSRGMLYAGISATARVCQSEDNFVEPALSSHS